MKIREILDVLFDIEKYKRTCFLCFKEDADAVDINEHLFVQDENESYYISVLDVVKEIFYIDTVSTLKKACSKCTGLVMQIFTIIKRYKQKLKLINLIVTNLSKEIDEKMFLLKFNCDVEKCELKLNINKEVVSKEEYTLTDSNQMLKENDKINNPTLTQSDRPVKLKYLDMFKATLCHICGKECKRPSLLKSHLNSHNQEKCPYCFKLLKTQAHFKYHIKQHETGAKRVTNYKSVYKCNECNYESRNKASLEAHINKEHLNVRPYVCQVCLKGFYKKSNLVEHSSVHTRARTETCEVCGDSFVNKKCLKEHLRLHSGEQPYECEICKTKFVTASRKTDHMKRKHTEKCELCVLCGKKYGLRKELNRHMRRKHAFDGDMFQDAALNPEFVNDMSYVMPDLGRDVFPNIL